MYVPRAQGRLPARGNSFSRWFGRSLLRLLGWRLAGELPKQKKVMAIIAPHTSNWDFIVGVGAMLAAGMRVSFLGKHTLFRQPWGWLFYWLGGIPVDRSSSHGVVPASIKAIKHANGIIFALAPEGTRSDRFEWKSGFYHIASGANIPLLPVRFENDRKVLRFGPLIHLDSEIPMERAIGRLKAFYLQPEWLEFDWKDRD